MIVTMAILFGWITVNVIPVQSASSMVSEYSNVTTPLTTSIPTPIPSWIKHTAKWWSEGQLEDSDFMQGIQYLLNQDIIKIPETSTQNPASSSQQIPTWIKNNARSWSEGQVGDSDFLKGIGYLLQNNVIHITIQTPIAPNLPANPRTNMTCPHNQTFNSQTNLCVPNQPSCSTGTTYDPNTKQCVKQNQATGIVCPNPAGTTYDPITKRCINPNQATGIVCPTGTTYDPNTKQCVKQNQATGIVCPNPAGTTYDPITKRCINPK